ncbi:HutP family protein [Turicibacter sp. TJ11]|uniref:HutP family protein n=1 Tax=Turicibacter sp. TJ11 TaxID=2806443 RepID=UPI001F414B73|nr:HutP family protein [Turicibacter sp. TJ11]
MKTYSSLDVAKAAIKVSMTGSRTEEEEVVRELKEQGIHATAVDIGGNLIQSIPKIIERAIIASRKTNVTKESFVLDGAVAGATRDAIMQVSMKATGLNAGGKIAIARCGENLTVCIFLSIGLLHLDDVVIGLAHRSVPANI